MINSKSANPFNLGDQILTKPIEIPKEVVITKGKNDNKFIVANKK